MKTFCQELLYKKQSHTLHKNCKVSLYSMGETISELIQRRLTELDIKKSELAKKAGVSRAYIGDLANGTAKTKSGHYRPKPEIVTSLAKALEVSETEILNAIGYASKEATDSYEILDGMTVNFDEKKFSKAEREKLLEAMRMLARGARASEAEKQ